MKLEAGGKQETNPLTLAVHLVQQRNKILKTGSAALVPTAITSTRRRDQTPKCTRQDERRREEMILSLLFTKSASSRLRVGAKRGRKAVVTEKVELGRKAHGKSSSRHALGVRALYTGAVRRPGPKAHRQGRCRQPRRSLKL
jgi:hypothetical protein